MARLSARFDAPGRQLHFGNELVCLNEYSAIAFQFARIRIRPRDLIRIVDAVAREVTAASDSGTWPLGLPADRRQGPIKSFAFELGNAERVGVSLPTQLRQRQRVMARVANVLRWPSEERARFSSW